MSFLIIFFFLGLSVGSFINVLVWRMHSGRSLRGRSLCVHCKKTILARDLIPVVSFFVLRGRCRYCKKRIPWKYPVVEFITAVAFTGVFWYHASMFNSIENVLFLARVVTDLALLSALIALFLFDLYYGILPDAITLPTIGFAAIALWWLDGFSGERLIAMIAGGTIGASFFAFQWVLSKGRWIGDGDIRLGALIGILLGAPAVLLGLALSYAIGSVVGVTLLCFGKKQWGSRIVLGPFLIIGALIVYYSSDHLLWLIGY